MWFDSIQSRILIDLVGKRKSLPSRESNSGRPARNPLSVLGAQENDVCIQTSFTLPLLDPGSIVYAVLWKNIVSASVSVDVWN
jgi:hypothetical protein